MELSLLAKDVTIHLANSRESMGKNKRNNIEVCFSKVARYSLILKRINSFSIQRQIKTYNERKDPIDKSNQKDEMPR